MDTKDLDLTGIRGDEIETFNNLREKLGEYLVKGDVVKNTRRGGRNITEIYLGASSIGTA